MRFNPFFTHEDVRRISESLSIPIDNNPHLSEESKLILKAVHFSRADLDRASRKMAIESLLHIGE